MLIKIFEAWNLFENSAHNSFKLALRDFMSIVNSVSEFKFENKFIHQCGSKINLKYIYFAQTIDSFCNLS